MHEDYLRLIVEVDKVLSLVREMWVESSDGSPEKRKHMKRLDELLEERMRLMRARDAMTTVKIKHKAVVEPVKVPKKRRAKKEPPVI